MARGLPRNQVGLILDHLPMALAVVDVSLRPVFTNRAFCDLLRFFEGEGAGTVSLSRIIPPEKWTNLLSAPIQLGELRETEIRLDLFKGQIKLIKARVTPVPLVPESQLFLLLFEDITEKTQLEQQLMQSQQLAAMGQLAVTIAHELGNPLSVISSTLQYIHEQLEQATDVLLRTNIREEIEVIIDNLAAMHELLSNLSEFNRQARPHFDFEDVGRALAQVLAFVSKEAEQRNVAIRTDFAHDVPRCSVDVKQLKQVFLNVLKNALEAMPDGGLLTVRLKTEPEEPPTNLVVEISDTGCGISPDELKLIFEPFHSTKPGGTGLGLSISRRIIERHKGTIAVSSEPGGGATFRITLPIVATHEVTDH